MNSCIIKLIQLNARGITSSPAKCFRGIHTSNALNEHTHKPTYPISNKDFLYQQELAEARAEYFRRVTLIKASHKHDRYGNRSNPKKTTQQ